MYKHKSFINRFFLKNRKNQYFFGFGAAFLLIFASFAIADTTEETAEAAEAAEPKKSPIKIGGAMRANYVYGTYTDGRGDDNGDVDLRFSVSMPTLTLMTSLVDWNTVGIQGGSDMTADTV